MLRSHKNYISFFLTPPSKPKISPLLCLDNVIKLQLNDYILIQGYKYANVAGIIMTLFCDSSSFHHHTYLYAKSLKSDKIPHCVRNI